MARRPGEYAMKTLFLICGLTAVAFVLLITGYLVLSGLPAIRETVSYTHLTLPTILLV